MKKKLQNIKNLNMISLIQKLRKNTDAGVIDCKNALIQSNGNIELAVENMRKLGIIKATKNINNITTQGIINTKIKNKYGVILEVNCQTDFVAKCLIFKEFFKKILNFAILNKITDIEILKKHFEEERIICAVKVNENINIHRFAYLHGEILGSYVHYSRIGVLTLAKNINQELLKHISMHIAASKPKFITSKDISNEIINKEYEIQLNIAMKSGKSKENSEKMIAGRMKTFCNNITLLNQPFIMDPKKLIKQVLKEHNSNIINFIRFELGENIKLN